MTGKEQEGYAITEADDEIVSRSIRLRGEWLWRFWKGARRLQKLRDGQLRDLTEVEYEQANERLHKHQTTDG